MAWDERMKDFHARRAKARAERLLDSGSFLEVGTFNTSDVRGMEVETPADSKVGGLGRIDGRPVVVCSNDFTVLAATSRRVASHKEAELKRLAARRGMPIVYLAEAGGARMPDIMGSAGIASFGNSTYYGTRRRRVPMVTAVSSAATPSASGSRARSSPGWRRSIWSRCRACPSSCATGVNVVHGAELAKLPPEEHAARRQALLAQWELDTLPYGAAARHLIDEVIDPADTRDVVIRFLAQARTRSAIGRHRLAGWPTTF